MRYRKEGNVLKAMISKPVPLGSWGHLWGNYNVVTNCLRHAKKHGVKVVDVYVKGIHAWRLNIGEHRVDIEPLVERGPWEPEDTDFEAYMKGWSREEDKD